ncbi:MAG: HEPN domain-containing protein [Candidatus Margulisbacteria bacterium]|jgi:HEPN domain-containing protein|nr:HEPN domain-containing protein [Candidatus Margulisiibacteriota bacterium]
MNGRVILLKQWQDKAGLDIKTIEILTKNKSAPRSVIAFHCQQAIEKYLKGFLCFQQIPFNKTHDLTALLELCLQKNSAFKLLNNDLMADIKLYAVDPRYPGEEYEPTKTEIAEYIKTVKQVKLLVEKLTKNR